MNQPRRRMVQQRPGQPDLAQRFVVGEHGKQEVALERVRRRLGRHGAAADKLGDGGGRSVPDRELMAGLQNIPGDGRAHVPKADESDLHVVLRDRAGRPGSSYFLASASRAVFSAFVHQTS